MASARRGDCLATVSLVTLLRGQLYASTVKVTRLGIFTAPDHGVHQVVVDVDDGVESRKPRCRTQIGEGERRAVGNEQPRPVEQGGAQMKLYDAEQNRGGGERQ